jgi:GT2 family glycosyltransferase
VRERDILIVCTKNRHPQVAARLTEFSAFEDLPNDILVVDSSDSPDTEVLVRSIASNYPTRLHYLNTSSGLPFQRNCGIEWTLKRPVVPEIVHFLDDDVVPCHDYFLRVRAFFGMSRELVAVGGFDVNYNPTLNQTLPRRILGIGCSRTGVVLKSGLAIPPTPAEELEECQWLVGGMQSFRTDVFFHQRFDSTLRMYGEDVDFYLRIASLGKIACSSRLPVIHLHDPTNRESYKDVCMYHDGVRWLFASRYPHRVRRSRVWLAALTLAAGELCRFIVSGDKKHLQGVRGHTEFLLRVAIGKQTLQTIVNQSAETSFDRQNC